MGIKELRESIKELRESSKAAIARDQKYLEKIESTLQKVSQDPVNKKNVAPLRGLKRAVLNQIKIHEKFLAQISGEEPGRNSESDPSKS